MLDRLAAAAFESHEPHAVLHQDLSQELESENGHATLRLPLPFADKGDIDLKKIGLEVIVRVGGQKRTILLPQAMAGYRPRGARFDDGALHVTFEREEARERVEG